MIQEHSWLVWSKLILVITFSNGFLKKWGEHLAQCLGHHLDCSHSHVGAPGLNPSSSTSHQASCWCASWEAGEEGRVSVPYQPCGRPSWSPWFLLRPGPSWLAPAFLELPSIWLHQSVSLSFASQVGQCCGATASAPAWDAFIPNTRTSWNLGYCASKPSSCWSSLWVIQILESLSPTWRPRWSFWLLP